MHLFHYYRENTWPNSFTQSDPYRFFLHCHMAKLLIFHAIKSYVFAKVTQAPADKTYKDNSI